MKEPQPPKALDAIADLVLAYRPKPKSKPAKKRKQRAGKVAKRTDVQKTLDGKNCA